MKQKAFITLEICELIEVDEIEIMKANSRARADKIKNENPNSRICGIEIMDGLQTIVVEPV